MKRRRKIEYSFNSILSIDELMSIFEFCDLKSLICCTFVCKKWNSIYHHKMYFQNLWKQLYQNNWRDIENMKLTDVDINEIIKNKGTQMNWFILTKKRFNIMKNTQFYSKAMNFFNEFHMKWEVPCHDDIHLQLTKENSKFPVFFFPTKIPTEKQLQNIAYIGRSIKIYNSTLINHYGFFTSWNLIRAIECSDRKRRNKEFQRYHHFQYQHSIFEGLYFREDDKMWVVSWT